MAPRPSSTIRPPITAPSWPRTCARCSIISASRAPTSWATRWARASAAFLALAHPGARAQRRASAGWASGWSTASALPQSIADALEAPSLADVQRSAGPRLPRLCRADQVRPQGARRLHPRLAPDAVAPRIARGSTCRCWSRSAPRTTSPARRTNWPRCCRRARALDIPGRDHMLAVGDKVFKQGVLAFLAQRP